MIENSLLVVKLSMAVACIGCVVVNPGFSQWRFHHLRHLTGSPTESDLPAMSLTDSPTEHQYYSSMDIQASPPKPINALSPSASAAREPKLQLPSTTDPPGPQNPPKQLVWLVRNPLQPFAFGKQLTDVNNRSSAQQATWVARSSKPP
jgi:hypothetical protein